AVPLGVYSDRAGGDHGYREQMRNLVTKAMDSWTAASRGAISFQLAPPDSAAEAAWQAIDQKKPILQRLERSLADVPSDPVSADIHVHWTHNLAGGLRLTSRSRLTVGDTRLRDAHSSP